MLLWVDCETTGLDPQQDIVLEIGLILMDEIGMRELGRRNWICKVYNFEFEPTDPFVHDMHTRNGLLDKLRNENTKVYPSYSYIDDEMCDWIMTYVDDQKLHPAGSSVHFDRDFIRRRFPRLEFHLHHRHFDVSSVKILDVLSGHEYDKGPDDVHRALSDLDNDISWVQKFLGRVLSE